MVEAKLVICAEARKCIFENGAEMVQKWCNSDANEARTNEAQTLAISGVDGDGEAIEPAEASGGRRLVRWALRAGERNLTYMRHVGGRVVKLSGYQVLERRLYQDEGLAAARGGRAFLLVLSGPSGYNVHTGQQHIKILGVSCQGEARIFWRVLPHRLPRLRRRRLPLRVMRF